MANPGKDTLGKWTLEKGYISAIMRGQGGNHMARGSKNGMVTGDGFIRAFKGPLLRAGLTGSRVSFITDKSHAGLGTVAVNGHGSVFKVRDLLFYIGAGQVLYAGVALAGIVASATLSFIRKVAGVYDVGTEYQAGHAQPSAPTLYPKDVPSAGKTAMSAAISGVIWRISEVDGQTSLSSLPSNVVTLSGQTSIWQVPLADANGQTHWGFGVPKVGFADLGNFYELPISAGGEIAESVLAYTRAVTGASIADTTSVVDITDADLADQFTSTDVGRRIAFSTFDSWITEIVSAVQCKVFDANTSGGTITGDATVTHAIDGILRGVEIAWTNGMLLGSRLAPDKAFPPVAADFAGAINEVFYLDADGIIYVSEPGETGSFAPRNTLFASEPAILFLLAEDGVKIRFGQTVTGALYYVGGSPALEYYEFRKQGIKYPQNAGNGFQGRVCAWMGAPCVISDNLEPDYRYASNVMPEFAGWNEQQTANKPIVFGYDGLAGHQFECWCFGKVVMAKSGPENAWCSPTDLDGQIPGNIVDAVTVDHALYLSVVNGAALAVYQYDAGTGSVMIIQTDDVPSKGSFDTVTEVVVQGRADNTTEPVVVEVIANFDDASPEPDQWDGEPEQLPARTGTQLFETRRPNVLDARDHAVLVTMTSEGGDCGVDKIETMGATSSIVV